MDIKQRRIDLGYKTKSDFARATGLSLASISKVERGDCFIKNMKHEFQERWARGLQCDIADLLKPEVRKMKAPCVFPCRCYKMDKDKLEKMLHEKYGDKIGDVKDKKINSLLCTEYRQYDVESRWCISDTRMENWGQ